MEQQGEKVQRLELLKKVSLARLAARHKRLTVTLRWLKAAVGNLFWGGSVKNHESKSGEVESQRGKQFRSQVQECASTFPSG